MRDIFQEFVDGTNNENTRKNRQTSLNQFDEWLSDDSSLVELSKLDLREWVNHLEDDVSDLTLKNYYYDVSTFYSWLEDWGEEFDTTISEEDNPFNGVELNDFGIDPNAPTRQQQARKSEEPYRALSKKQVEKLIKNVPGPSVRNELVIRTLYQTGVRTSELVSIELDDIDRDSRQIRIDSAKTESFRTVFYQESLETLLSLYIDGGDRSRSMHSESSPYLFTTRQSKQISKSSVGEIVSKAAENADIQGDAFQYHPGGIEKATSYSKITPHVLRHTFAHHSIHNGDRPDIVTLSKVMGHESVETTKIYLDAGIEKRRDLMHKTGPGFRKSEL